MTNHLKKFQNTCIKKGGVLENASKLKTKNTKVNWINIMKTKFSQGNIREVAKILQRMPYFLWKTITWLASVFYPRGTFFLSAFFCTLFIFQTKRAKLASSGLVVVWQPCFSDAAFMFISIKLPKRNMNRQCTKEKQIKTTDMNNYSSLLKIRHGK